jgi:DNA-binding NarL/FixJ family response regulator
MEAKEDLSLIYTFHFHSSLDSLKNELDLKSSSNISIIDVSDINYQLFTNSYFINHPNVKFIGIGIKKDVEKILNLSNTNISAYFTIENTSLYLIKAIKNIGNNTIYLCDYTKDFLINNNIFPNKLISSKFTISNKISIINNMEQPVIEAVTEREKKVVDLLLQGLSYKEIAHLLEVSTFAINQHTKSIYKKLKVRSRSELSFKFLN